MTKSFVICILLVLLAALAAFAAPSPGSTAPAMAAVPAPAQAPPAASPAAPAKTPGEAELPDVNFTPKPNYVCLFGWCSSDAQCKEWYDRLSKCYIQPGGTCGQCT